MSTYIEKTTWKLTFVKHSNNGDFRFKIHKNFVRSLESPSVKRLVDSHIGDYISNSNTISKNANMEAKDTGLLRIEI